jgi:hypothetical protein
MAYCTHGDPVTLFGLGHGPMGDLRSELLGFLWGENFWSFERENLYSVHILSIGVIFTSPLRVLIAKVGGGVLYVLGRLISYPEHSTVYGTQMCRVGGGILRDFEKVCFIKVGIIHHFTFVQVLLAIL